MKYMTILALPLFLIGCQTSPQLIKTELKAVPIPTEIFKHCKDIPIPDPTKMTVRQLNSLLIQLKTTNKDCILVIKAIEDYLQKSGVIIERKD